MRGARVCFGAFALLLPLVAMADERSAMRPTNYTPPALEFTYPDGQPRVGYLSGTTFRVGIAPGRGTPVPSTATLYCSYDGRSYASAPLMSQGLNRYEATLPPTGCGERLRWYVGVRDTAGVERFDPPRAPLEVHSAVAVTSVQLLLADDFETDLGWTVYAGAQYGNWQRADPQLVEYSGGITQPEDDHSPDGTLCYVTGALAGRGAGNHDVDGGPTYLISPVFALNGTDALVSYWRWFHVSTQRDNGLLVEVSNNNGNSWVTVETVRERQEWTPAEFLISDSVTPTNQVRVRFTVDDSPNGALIEALIDDFRVERLICTPGLLPGDLNCDGIADGLDVDAFILAVSDPAGYAEAYPACDRQAADCNADGAIDVLDIDAFVEMVVEE